MEQAKEKIISRNFCLCFTSLLSLATIMYLLMSTITEYAAEFGATPLLAGMVSGFYVVGGIFGRMMTGGGLARFGWKRFAFSVMLLHTLACVLYFFANGITALLLLRLFHGIVFGASSSSIMTIGTSVLPRSRYNEATGWFMLSTTLAVALGPYCGGLIYDHFGGTGCFVSAFLLSAIMFACTMLTKTEGIEPPRQISTQKAENAPRGIYRFLEPKAIPVSSCILLAAIGYVSLLSFYRSYGAETGLEKEFSRFFLIYTVVLLISRPVAGKIQDRFGDNPVCYPGILAQVLGLVLIALKPCMLTIVICAIGCGVGYGTLNSAINAIVCRSADGARRSYTVSTFWILCDGGMGFGPALLGGVATAAGYPALYLAAAGASLLCLPLYHLVWGRSGGKTKKTEAAK